MQGLKVTYGKKIKSHMLNFPISDLDIIAEFIEHLILPSEDYLE